MFRQLDANVDDAQISRCVSANSALCAGVWQGHSRVSGSRKEPEVMGRVPEVGKWDVRERERESQLEGRENGGRERREGKKERKK